MKTQPSNRKVWNLLPRLLLLPLIGLAPKVWGGEQGVDVEKYQDELNHQIEQLKSDAVQAPSAPAPTTAPTPVEKKEVKKGKRGKPAVLPTPSAPEKKSEDKDQAEKAAWEDLQNQVKQLAQKMSATEGSGSPFKFSLLFQGRGTINDNPTVKLAGNTVYEGLDDSNVPGTVNDQLFFRRAEMKFYGGFSDNTIQYAVMIDPVGVPAATKNLVQDYYITASPAKYLDVAFGQTKYPQGLEGRTSSAKLDFINRSTLGSGNGFGDQRDLMVQVSGTKVPLAQDLTLDYALAAVNGQGRNNPENNNSKDGAARLGLQYKGLWLGGSAYDGYEQAPGAAAALEMWRAGLECQWVLQGVLRDKDSLKLQAEWGQGSLVNENGLTKAAFTAASGATGASGFYLEGLYRLGNTRGGLRYELWDPKDTSFNSPGSYQNYLTLGLDQYFSEDRCRVSANWIHPILDNAAGGVLSVGEVGEAQFQLTF